MAEQETGSEISIHCADCEKIVAYASEIILIKGGGIARLDPDRGRRPDNSKLIPGESICPEGADHTLILTSYAFKKDGTPKTKMVADDELLASAVEMGFCGSPFNQKECDDCGLWRGKVKFSQICRALRAYRSYAEPAEGLEEETKQ